MEAVVGVFALRTQAELAVGHLREAGLQDLTLLTPNERREEVEHAVKTEDMEGRGVGEVIGGVVGGAIGMAGGSQIGTAVALLIPGVGSILGFGLLGAVILGAGGVAAGMAAGWTAETAFGYGMPKDELFLYEDALRQGRSVVIAWAKSDSSAHTARQVLWKSNAETLDAARERWWMGLRDVEQEHYSSDGHDFAADEECYRSGFEAALRPELRGKSFEEALGSIRKLFPVKCDEPAFQHGYERGLAYDRKCRSAQTRA